MNWSSSLWLLIIINTFFSLRQHHLLRCPHRLFIITAAAALVISSSLSKIASTHHIRLVSISSALDDVVVDNALWDVGALHRSVYGPDHIPQESSVHIILTLTSIPCDQSRVLAALRSQNALRLHKVYLLLRVQQVTHDIPLWTTAQHPLSTRLCYKLSWRQLHCALRLKLSIRFVNWYVVIYAWSPIVGNETVRLLFRCTWLGHISISAPSIPLESS